MKKFLMIMAILISFSAFADYECAVTLDQKDMTRASSESYHIKVNASIFEGEWTPFKLNTKDVGLIKGHIKIDDTKKGTSSTRPVDGVIVALRVDKFKRIQAKGGRFLVGTFAGYREPYVSVGISGLYLECFSR